MRAIEPITVVDLYVQEEPRNRSSFYTVRDFAFTSLLILGLGWFVAVQLAPYGLLESQLVLWPGLAFQFPLIVHRAWGLLWFAAFMAFVLLDLYRPQRAWVDDWSGEDDLSLGITLLCCLAAILLVGLLTIAGARIGAVGWLLAVAGLSVWVEREGLTDSWSGTICAFLFSGAMVGTWCGFQTGLVSGLASMAAVHLMAFFFPNRYGPVPVTVESRS